MENRLMITLRIFLMSLASAACFGMTVRGQVPQPIVDFSFDRTPTMGTEPNGGNDAHNVSIQFKDAKGGDTNSHGAPGSGVTGNASDLSFDNSASTTMGVPGPGGVAVSNGTPAGLIELTSFTFTGWFRTHTGTSIGNGARLFDTFGRMGLVGTNLLLMGGSPSGTLNLGINGGSVTSDSVYGATDAWVFYAVSYNKSAESDNVVFYAGDLKNPVSIVSKRNFNKQPAASINALLIGNRVNRDRPFQGSIDNFKIFASSTDGSGALSLEQVQAVCDADKAVGATSPKKPN